jgi:hypothetical protein
LGRNALAVVLRRLPELGKGQGAPVAEQLFATRRWFGKLNDRVSGVFCTTQRKVYSRVERNRKESQGTSRSAKQSVHKKKAWCRKG